jgi:hypothetical protein
LKRLEDQAKRKLTSLWFYLTPTTVSSSTLVLWNSEQQAVFVHSTINDGLGEEWKYKWHSLSEEFLSLWLKTSYHQLSGSLHLLHLVSVELLWKLVYIPSSSSFPWLALQGDWRIRVLGWATSLKFQYQFWLKSYKSHKTMLCISTSNSPTNWKWKMKIHPIRWIDARLMKVGLNKNFKTLKLIQELHLLEGLALLQLQRASSSTLLLHEPCLQGFKI